MGDSNTNEACATNAAIGRRDFMRLFGAASVLGGFGGMTTDANAAVATGVVTGTMALNASGFAALSGRRVGLITNQTGLAGGQHIADLMHADGNVRLVTIFAPEHGFRGTAEAGATVADGHDTKTGVRVTSLYGASRKPTAKMLRDIDVLVFDIQDVGVRFYTYISTMGLAMQAAAESRIPFVVLDRPNPIGGEDVSGFVIDTALRSFVGQYPIPIVHGMTVGELARMIVGERWLGGLASLDLSVIELQGWRRAMRWPRTGLGWVATSPNIPTFETALAYPGIGLVGETLVNEGRGTPTPFLRFGAPWLDAARCAKELNGKGLPGVRFVHTAYTPRSIPNVAADPRFEGRKIPGIAIDITDADTYRPLEVGMYALAHLAEAAHDARTELFGKLAMFHATSGTRRLHDMLAKRASGDRIIAAWAREVDRFRRQRERYLIY